MGAALRELICGCKEGAYPSKPKQARAHTRVYIYIYMYVIHEPLSISTDTTSPN